jgi:tetratricopeptide (TPR) repeat protein
MLSTPPSQLKAEPTAREHELAEVHFQRGNAAGAAGRFADAIAYFDAALGLFLSHVDAHINRGYALQELGRPHAALASFDRALAIDARRGSALGARGGLLKEIGRLDEALVATRAAMRAAPDDINIRKQFFWLQVASQADSRTLGEAGNEVARLSVKVAREALRARRAISDFRAAHDLAQTDYLLAEGFSCAGLAEANAHLRDICARAPKPGETPQQVPITDTEIAVIGRFREQRVRFEPDVPAACLNPDLDWKAIERDYFAAAPEVAVIDDFLSPAALRELQRFALVSTVWKSEYLHQYLGAFAEDGFLSALHVQIAGELKVRLPRILGAQTLEHLWGFKYAPRVTRGIDVHADFAKVNLNFWITPDTANLDPAGGGLVIYDTPAPTSWTFRDYNADKSRIAGFLASRHAARRKIPYRCNRAVLFNASLFHETDAIHFKDGYENQRINMTYLFGRGLAMG